MWYCPRSVVDSSRKKYDGLGYRGVLETRSEPRYHMANLLPKEAWIWPPHPERNVAKEVTVMCPDVRTAVILHLEAVDLVDKGYDIIFFRRNMSILGKILQKKEGIKIDKIIDEFSSDEIEIYPTLNQMIIPPFIEELELMGYVDVRDEIVSGTEKGRAKLEDFVESLSEEERAALHM